MKIFFFFYNLQFVFRNFKDILRKAWVYMTGNFTQSKCIPKHSYFINCLFIACSKSASTIQEFVLKHMHVFILYDNGKSLLLFLLAIVWAGKWHMLKNSFIWTLCVLHSLMKYFSNVHVLPNLFYHNIFW